MEHLGTFILKCSGMNFFPNLNQFFHYSSKFISLDRTKSCTRQVGKRAREADSAHIDPESHIRGNRNSYPLVWSDEIIKAMFYLLF